MGGDEIGSTYRPAVYPALRALRSRASLLGLGCDQGSELKRLYRLKTAHCCSILAPLVRIAGATAVPRYKRLGRKPMRARLGLPSRRS